MAKKLRLLAAVVISSLFVLWRTSILLEPRLAPGRLDVSDGDRFCPQLFGSAENSTRDIFVISTDSVCPYCELAKPFEAALEEFGHKAGIRTMYLFTDGPSGEPLAERYQATGRSVIRASLSEMAVRLNPTFLRVSSTGVVKAVWIGAFETESAQKRAWAILTEEKRGGLTNATSADLAVAASGKGAVIVGFSPAVLARYPMAKYYDRREFSGRAKSELDQGRGVILDCQSAQSPFDCRSIGRGLIQTGYSEVHTIGMSSGRTLCPNNSSLSGILGRNEMIQKKEKEHESFRN